MRISEQTTVEGARADQRKLVIGVVGGIGAGKSTVARMLGERGGLVIDADRLGHEALELPAVRERLIQLWGPGILKADGHPDRRAIAKIVFGDPAERTKLEALVFGEIEAGIRRDIASAQSNPDVRFVVLDAAIMLETGWAKVCDHIVFVDAPLEVRLARVAERSGWTADQVASREAAQMDLATKRQQADVVILNTGSPDRLSRELDQLLQQWSATS